MRDSNPCAFSVKEMCLKGKAHCGRAQKSNTLSTTPRRQLMQVDVLVVCIRACWVKHRPRISVSGILAERWLLRGNLVRIACGYFSIGYNESTVGL